MTVRVLQGDCLSVLKTLPEESIDAVVTDPPYGIGFMGKEWDTFKPGAGPEPVRNRESVSENPNVRGRKRSPAASPSGVSYDESPTGHRKFQAWTEGWAREALRVMKPGAHLLVCGAPRSYHRIGCGIEDAGFEVRDVLVWMFGQGFPKSSNQKGDWEGWGTALKPAWEPIVMARKPLIGTVAENLARYGLGALNIDGCRIGPADTRREKKGGAHDFPHEDDSWTPRAVTVGSDKGRWPANLLHDGSNEVVAAFPAEAGAFAPVHRRQADKTRNSYGAFKGGFDEQGSTFHADSGSAARFFWCPKASRRDRNQGLSGFQAKPLNWSSGDQSPGTFQAPGTDRSSENFHPTVKPTALMQELVRLVTPKGGTVLDPFMGSGSTGKAALREGMTFIGIERDPDYCEIARQRIRGDCPMFTEISA